ncbi:glycosyltransferase family 1 protein [Halomonas sp. HP20-15]|uniref:glycosyltransferase family 4 protein n=1 Tax=Halomonas sp. HP20-15 TaxID=3085901 RepID=UPI0029814CB1|nr:glycosyltransferase family 1 protein [Halomonas sp. HP20-15]MDW5377032.1 glycosyltransferase family 1 protein [Halomonas sp. HP20-15]
MIYIDGIVFSLQQHGGISVYFHELYSRLVAANAKAKLLIHEKSELNVTLSSLDNKQGLVQKKSRPLERYMRSDVDSDCVFHSSYYRIPSLTVPTVTTVHDFTYEKLVSGPRKWVHVWQKNESIKKSDVVICISNNTAKDLMQYCKVEESKIEIVYNGVSECYRPLSDYDLTTEQVLFVGSRTGHKNFKIAAQAVSQCSFLELTVIGGGGFTKREKAFLDEIMPGRYRHMGHLSNKQLNYMYNSSYCLLYPSSYEGFGIPIIEAMRAGCPVIAINASSIPEVAGEAALLVERPDIRLLADALKNLKIGRERERLVRAGLEQANKFSWQKCFEETYRIYERLQ